MAETFASGSAGPGASVALGTVTVRYFAAAIEAAGREEEQLAGCATVGELRDALVERYGPAMARVVANGSFLVDGVVSRDPATPLAGTVDVLPPFAGG
ncbi:putative molybdenum cofactor biosynthesis protein D2 / thiamineS [Agromyces rhizosphaerae]|uniref:Molybdenum cofactor biosynthesis protein D2 / thiamineS n=1 Tax=Agromyces rhizosphaerae TaxID=88374 RepID=A0A9W6CT06_9MICO|nr:MoaD/ThiS family protein [Agromyces rhizosphaerae]GLI26284.1 putative molybdenum cofactor biosynthesis protein D2 / thiamineS [Agromyces rhizosphaerae]